MHLPPKDRAFKYPKFLTRLSTREATLVNKALDKRIVRLTDLIRRLQDEHAVLELIRQHFQDNIDALNGRFVKRVAKDWDKYQEAFKPPDVPKKTKVRKLKRKRRNKQLALPHTESEKE